MKNAERPLFLAIGFPGPHPPYDSPLEMAQKYMDRDLPLQEVTQEELDGQPEVYKRMRAQSAPVRCLTMSALTRRLDTLCELDDSVPIELSGSACFSPPVLSGRRHRWASKLVCPTRVC